MYKWAFALLLFSIAFAEEIGLEVPLYINTEQIGQTTVYVDIDHDIVRIDIEQFISAVDAYIVKSRIQDLREFLSLIRYVPENDAMGNNDFKIYFSTRDQTLHLDTNLKFLKAQLVNVVSYSNVRHTHGAKKIEPEAFSGYLNIEGGIRDRHNIQQGFRPEGLSSFGNLNCCLHYNDTILTAYGYVLSDNNWGINAVNGVLSKQFPKSGVQWSAGTINSTGISFQGSLPIIGINFAKHSGLLTDSTVGSMSRHDLFLNAPSQVKVFVNGVEVNMLDLPAGNHRLQNFPLAQGLNNVMLKIEGPTGEEREIDISMFYNPGLLKPGEVEANITAGVPYYNSAKGSEGFYSFVNRAALSGYAKRGFSDFLTLAGYFQAERKKIFSGIQGILSRPYFKTISEVGVSQYGGRDLKFKTRVAILQPEAWKVPVTWNIAIDGTEKGFRFFGGTDKDENTAYLVSGSLGTSALKMFSTNLIYQYGMYRDLGGKNSVQATFGFRPRSWFNIRAIVRWEKFQTGRSKTETAFNLDITPKFDDFGTQTSYNSHQKALSTALTYNRALPGRRSISGNIGYNKAPGSGQLEGKVDYEGTFFKGKASHRLYKASATDIYSTLAVTNASASTALVFAGKKVAVSRPVKDSFVIIAPNKYLRNSPVIVSPSKDDYLAKASYFFPSVVPLSSYSSSDYSIMKDDGSYGGDFEDAQFNVKTLNHSGSVIEVGDKPKYIVEGTLFDCGEPAVEITGMMISNFEENGKKLKYRFFTDDEGVFQVINLVPGNYNIRFTNKHFATIYDVEISEEEDGINYINIGDYIIQRRVIKKKHSEVRN